MASGHMSENRDTEVGADQPGRTRRGFMSTAGAVAVGAMGVAGATSLQAINNDAKARGQPIPLGSMLPLTGWGAADAVAFQAGISLAVEEINAIGGVLGRPIEMVFEDTKEVTPETVTRAARRLIDRHGVHAIVNGYNSPSQRAEYDIIADAGIAYIHDNTDYGHEQAISADPERYWCIFQADPSEYYYGPALLHFLDSLEKSGRWTRPNNKLALLSGSINYSAVVAQGIRDSAPGFGWELAIDDEVKQPVEDWTPSLVRIGRAEPAVIATTHGFVDDQIDIVRKFRENPTPSLMYVQYALQLRSFLDAAETAAEGVLSSSIVATLPDEIGTAFAHRLVAKYGADATPAVAGQTYDSLYTWAIAAAIAGGSGAPYDGVEQNKKLCDILRQQIYRGVVGAIRYLPGVQAAASYPASTKDPSLGTPAHMLQCQNWREEVALVGPEPYATAEWVTPPWLA